MLLGNIAIIERIPVVGDQGDNILRVGLVLLLFMHTTEYWSLDARRRARRGAHGTRSLPRWLSNGIHNITLAALAFQLVICTSRPACSRPAATCGSTARRCTTRCSCRSTGRSRSSPTCSPTSGSWSASRRTSSSSSSSASFALLHPVARRVAIASVIVLHVSIAVLMALPWFSLSMLAFVAIFVSTSTYVALVRSAAGGLVRRDDLRHAAAGQHEDDDG